jgi:hypothetical protein
MHYTSIFFIMLTEDVYEFRIIQYIESVGRK